MFVILFVFLALLTLAVPLVSTHAQCPIPQGWVAYTVQPGDTLARIAARYGTTWPVLQQSNCLSSTRLNAYWIIYVPPVGQPPPVGRTTTTYATYQPFQNGFMVWSADSSAISAYLGGSAQLRSFAARTYSQWAGPASGSLAPIPYYLPQQGFGKVWASARGIGAALGWAIGPEIGYTMTVNYNASSRVTNFSLPTGQFLVNNFNGTWSYTQAAPLPVPTFVAPPPPLPTATPYLLPNPPAVGFTYLPFEGGFMVWRADTSDIYAYINATSELFVFRGADYGRLGINYGLVPPPGRFRPDNGFGRVWSNYGNIRAALGWALGGEQGYLSVVQSFSSGVLYSFTLPNGRTATRVNDRIFTIL
jgi:hypothetical protein